MKRITTLFSLLMLAAILLSACGGAAPTQPAATAVPAQPAEKTIGLVLSTLNNPFFVTLKEGAQKAADAAGVKLIVVDAQDDSAKMTAGIEDLLTKKVSAILINPTDSDAVVPSIQKANAAKIPVFTVDRGANGGTVVAHVASDNVAGGQMAAEFLCKTIGAKGNVVELQGIAGTSAARDRGKGFNDYMAANCKDAKIVAQQTANFNRDEGLKVFENILQAQPDIAAVFAHNDEMILGAIQAADAAKRSGIVFVGFDAVDDAVKAVKDGKLAATVAQQPAEIGRLGLETAVKYLNGETVPAAIPVPLSLVSAESLGVTVAPAKKEVTLGLVLSTLNNPFFVTLKDGAQKAADAAGAKLIVVDAQDDSAKMVAGIEDLITKKVSAILINPTDSDAVVPAIQKANQAGIPVFTVDRGANGGTVVAHVASDNVAGGQMAAEYLCKAIGGKGNVVELQGIAGTSAARDRGKGFNDYMTANCKDAKIVAQQTANFNRDEGLKVFENILQAQPEIAAVFAHNDEMILGAIQAADAAKRAGIIFVGFDAVDDAVKAVNDGKLAATVAQQPAEIGRLGVEAALKFLNGETVTASIPVPLSLVTK